MVIKVFQLLFLVAYCSQCFLVSHDFYIHGSINGKGKLLLLEVENLAGRKIQLSHNDIDSKVGHIAFHVLMFQSQISLAFLNQAPCRTDKVIVFYQGFLFQLLLWKLVFVIFIRHAVPAVDMLNEIPEVVLIQASHLEASGDFIFQQFFHFHVTVDFII